MLTVLVADDEFAVLEVLSMALEGEGYHVLKAGDGADALRLLASQPCDVVVCDDVMPVMSGTQLVAAMRADARLARIPVVLMIDLYGPGADRTAPGLALIPKPVMLHRLLELVAQAAAARTP